MNRIILNFLAKKSLGEKFFWMIFFTAVILAIFWLNFSDLTSDFFSARKQNLEKISAPDPKPAPKIQKLPRKIFPSEAIFAMHERAILALSLKNSAPFPAQNMAFYKISGEFSDVMNFFYIVAQNPQNYIQKFSLQKDARTQNTLLQLSVLVYDDENFSYPDPKISRKIFKDLLFFPQNFRVSVILNGAAKINGIWRKVGQNIGGYTISEISYNSVVLVRGSKKIVLKIK